MTVGRIRTPWIHSPNHPPPPLKHTELSPGVALWNWLCFQGGKGHSYVLFISPPTSYPLSVSSLSRQKKTKSCCRAAALLSWRLLNVCVLPLVRVCVFLCTCHTIMVAVSKPGWLTVSCLDWCHFQRQFDQQFHCLCRLSVLLKITSCSPSLSDWALHVSGLVLRKVYLSNVFHLFSLLSIWVLSVGCQVVVVFLHQSAWPALCSNRCYIYEQKAVTR